MDAAPRGVKQARPRAAAAARFLPRRRSVYDRRMKKVSDAAEEARQWAMTIRLLFAVGALAGLVACLLVARML
jgi:hypothetical protein